MSPFLVITVLFCVWVIRWAAVRDGWSKLVRGMRWIYSRTVTPKHPKENVSVKVDVKNEEYTVLSMPKPPIITVVSPSMRKRLVSLARSAILAALAKGVLTGRVELIDTDGKTYAFGVAENEILDSAHHGKLYIRDEAFWARTFFSGDIGFAEAFMNGEITSPQLKAILNVYVDNSARFSGLDSVTMKVTRVMDVIFHRFWSHGFTKSIKNVAIYNASNDFYQAILSKEMQYSCPVWSDAEGGVRGDLDGVGKPEDLEAAQERKIKWVLEKARAKPGHRILEIGTGWGSVAIEAARMGCTVDTITLSVEQLQLAESRIRAAGFESKVEVHFLDYRNLPPSFKNAFDACVSFEMLEAVGVKYMSTYIKTIDWALKDQDAIVVLSATSYPDATFTRYQADDFVRKYHWPHTIPPSPTWLAERFTTICKGRLSLDYVEDMGIHYPRCLREWNRRLQANWTPELVESLQTRYPVFKDPHSLAVFKRRWEYMFMYMDVAYSKVWLSLVYWTFVRPRYAAKKSSA